MDKFITKKGDKDATSSQESSPKWTTKDRKQEAPRSTHSKELNDRKNSTNKRHSWKPGDLCLVKTLGLQGKEVLAYIVEVWHSFGLCRIRYADESVPDVCITIPFFLLKKVDMENQKVN